MFLSVLKKTNHERKTQPSKQTLVRTIYKKLINDKYACHAVIVTHNEHLNAFSELPRDKRGITQILCTYIANTLRDGYGNNVQESYSLKCYKKALQDS